MGEARSQRPKFENKIHNSPVGAVEHRCLQAGLHRMPDVRPGARLARKWQGQGPYTACQFFRVKLYKPLVGQGCLVRHPNLESTPPAPISFESLHLRFASGRQRCRRALDRSDAYRAPHT